LMDVSRLHSLGWRASTDLEQGISLAYQDFLQRLA
jgi:GDP-L-fucose synthase